MDKPYTEMTVAELRKLEQGYLAKQAGQPTIIKNTYSARLSNVRVALLSRGEEALPRW